MSSKLTVHDILDLAGWKFVGERRLGKQSVLIYRHPIYGRMSEWEANRLEQMNRTGK